MAIALVTHVSRTLPGTSASIDTTGATLLVAAVFWTTSSVSQATIADNKSNTWFIAAISIGQQTATCALYYAINPTVGSGHTFTLTGNVASMCVASFSGTATSFVSSKSSASSVTGSTTALPGSLTPEVDNCLMLTAMSNRVATTYSVDSSYTITDQIAFAGGTNSGGGLAYLVQGATAALSPTWSWTGSGVAGVVQIYVAPPVSPGNILPVN